jgi:hypothetical protein
VDTQYFFFCKDGPSEEFYEGFGQRSEDFNYIKHLFSKLTENSRTVLAHKLEDFYTTVPKINYTPLN